MTAPRKLRQPDRKAYLRIGEFARRAGVSRATIQHYLHEGLLPRPHKTGRTMAYYDAAWVERVRLIKELQRRYLPLSVIRRLLARPETAASIGAANLSSLIAAGQGVEALLVPAERGLDRAEVAAEIGLGPEAQAALEKIGLVSARRGRGKDVFGPSDVVVLRAVAELSRAGMNAEAGFRLEDLKIYYDAVSSLLSQEVSLFTDRFIGARSQTDLVRLGTAAALGATELIAALHRKLVGDFVASASRATRRPRAR